MTQLRSLQTKAKALYFDVVKRQRKLHNDRIALGKMFLKIHGLLAQPRGGKPEGTFTAWIVSNGMNVGTVYNWMNLAKNNGEYNQSAPSRVRILFWQKFAAKVQKAKNDAEKARLLEQAIEWIKSTYDINATVKVTTRKAAEL